MFVSRSGHTGKHSSHSKLSSVSNNEHKVPNSRSTGGSFVAARLSCESLKTSRRIELGESKFCLVAEKPMRSVPASGDAKVYGLKTKAIPGTWYMITNASSLLLRGSQNGQKNTLIAKLVFVLKCPPSSLSEILNKGQ